MCAWSKHYDHSDWTLPRRRLSWLKLLWGQGLVTRGRWWDMRAGGRIISVLNISQISQKTSVFESLFNKVIGLACNFTKRDSNTGVFLWIFKNTFFCRTQSLAASAPSFNNTYLKSDMLSFRNIRPSNFEKKFASFLKP